MRLSNITLVEDDQINKFVTPTDLAFYITLTALSSLNRKEIKEHILSSSQFKNLMEIVPETSDIVENYLNGRY